MESTALTAAKADAKKQSLDKSNRDVPFYIIHCRRLGDYYIDTNCLIRNWEQLIGYYVNGVFNNNPD